MNHHIELALVHEIVDREIKNLNPSMAQREPRFPSLLTTLLSESEDIISSALGETGSRLRAFANAVQDSKHPDLQELRDGVLGDDKEFSTVASEIVKLTSLASGANLNNVIPYINKIVPKLSNYFSKVKDLDDPNKNLNHIRFLPNKEIRDRIRCQKKVQTVNIQAMIQKLPNQWDHAASSFLSLPRNQTPFKEDIDIANRRTESLASIGALGLANRAQNRATEFKQYKQEQYYGFNRLTVTLASIIASKVMGCSLNFSSIRSNRIGLPLKTHKAIFEKIGESCPARNGVVLYEPRLYPFHLVEHLCSDRTKSLIDALDNFPEAGGHPIFDHFWCLVPSIFILNIPESYVSCDLKESAKNFDYALLKHLAIPAVLLADKDGKTYFIDYW